MHVFHLSNILDVVIIFSFVGYEPHFRDVIEKNIPILSEDLLHSHPKKTAKKHALIGFTIISSLSLNFMVVFQKNMRSEKTEQKINIY